MRETAEQFAKKLMALPQSYEHSWEERASVLVSAHDRETAEEMRERAADVALRAARWQERDPRKIEADIRALPLDPPAETGRLKTSEFCRWCGAGIGKFRRPDEGTCQVCDPEGLGYQGSKKKI